MSKEYLYGIIGLLAGVILTAVFASNVVNTNNVGMMRMMGMNLSGNMMGKNGLQNGTNMMGLGSSMQDMMSAMSGKSGDSFDMAFMEAMIVHHQGAIDMARQAKINAEHDEIKSMADDIISTQTKEIEMMQQWQKDWGYE
jgi:uncharacterized protein (DUF305 family)